MHTRSLPRAGGFPMILRHRLHCTVVRAPEAKQSGDLSSTWVDGHSAHGKVCYGWGWARG